MFTLTQGELHVLSLRGQKVLKMCSLEAGYNQLKTKYESVSILLGMK